MGRKKPWVIAILFILLAGTATWTLYFLLSSGMGSILGGFGVESVVARNAITLLFILLLFVLLGVFSVRGKKSPKRVFNVIRKSFEKIAK